MTIPNIWENKKWQPNHQPEIVKQPDWVGYRSHSTNHVPRKNIPGKAPPFGPRPFWLWCSRCTSRSPQGTHPLGKNINLWSSYLCWLVCGWATPLKKIWVRQLGWLSPIYGKIKNGNQTTNQESICDQPETVGSKSPWNEGAPSLPLGNGWK